MKKYIYAIVACAAMLFSSCSNDDIVVVTADPVVKDAVTVNIPLSKLFESYNFYDTKHNRNISEYYRVFNSEYDMYIIYGTLFYNKDTGNKVSSMFYWSNSTNAQSIKADLPEGRYYAVTTLFLSDDKGLSDAYWFITGTENIKTLKLDSREYVDGTSTLNSTWSIASVCCNEFEVSEGKQVSVNADPQPIGALCYKYFENFQYKDETSNSVISDNKIRQLSLYTQKFAVSYNLNPNAVERYVYRKATGSGSYWKMGASTPKDYDSKWTHFKTNLYGFCYILAPSCDIQFGYILEGEEGFNGFGKANYTIEAGKVYLAYWDWFQVGNPYFGIADNNHWNNYESNAPSFSISPKKKEFANLVEKL